MTFNEDSRIGGGKVSHRGRNTAIGLGGGGLGVLAIVLISQLVGFDLTGLLGGGQPSQQEGEPIANCETGADANESIDCRIAFAAESLDTYWADTLPEFDAAYRTTSIVIFEGQTNTGCGAASSAVGPFYCPADETIYLDTSFYELLRTQFGSSGGSLAEMYVIAHEWGHHIQNVTGIMNGLDLQDSGPTSDGVRLEVQADCFAGAWVGAASTIKDANGVTFLEPVTREQIADALSAASAVGDDRIQESTQGQVTPETWTHGSSEMRQQWFVAGYEGGPNACNTFDAGAL
jgi:predicted metalloprotease